MKRIVNLSSNSPHCHLTPRRAHRQPRIALGLKHAHRLVDRWRRFIPPAGGRCSAGWERSLSQTPGSTHYRVRVCVFVCVHASVWIQWGKNTRRRTETDFSLYKRACVCVAWRICGVNSGRIISWTRRRIDNEGIIGRRRTERLVRSSTFFVFVFFVRVGSQLLATRKNVGENREQAR